MKMLKNISLLILITGYLCAGANHFRQPASYIRIIPPYIPYPKLMNILAGAGEILFGLLLVSPKTRMLGAWGIILLLIAFLPVHINMIGNKPFKLEAFMVTPLMAWLRLALQPVLMAWAWWHIK